MLISGIQSELKRMQFAGEVDGSMHANMLDNSQWSFHVMKYAKKAVL